MILLLNILRAASLLLWAVNVYRLSPDAWRALTAKRRHLDPIWAVAWGLAFNRLWFVGRDVFYHPEPGPIEAGLLVVGYMTACVLAAAIFRLRGTYGD
ncbi:hypothetical protein SAMN05192583_2112 [Sphingomonas gellani]|uniref:Uncharacterized protein n=1 Tax=Sphingomonas gellani TaxID=1166340 RepID=A0A1H8EAN6_9SPHN|nr:hypothetical protein [Sphingomonas gellani]SEN16579.1 hypothetical protein SAMN05192583_2112 [Sphingomonas gellani]